MSRDNFTKKTIEILAKRVGYQCSNPNCQASTVGPNKQEDKITLIGIAAHITAASEGGPRYEDKITEEERKSIKNGIWLCSNCSTLIDKNPTKYPIPLLHEWKEIAEHKMTLRLKGESNENKNEPYLEIDFVNLGKLRRNRGYDRRANFQKFKGNIIPVGGKPIIFWELQWRFKLVIVNNSKNPAFNIALKEVDTQRFLFLSKLPQKNNIPPYKSIDINVHFIYRFCSSHVEVDELLKQNLPKEMDGISLFISYTNEAREEKDFTVTIENATIKRRPL